MSYGDYPNLSKVKKVLVVKLRHLGDVLLTGPVFSALKEALPHAQIDAYVYEEAKPMLEGHPAISHLLGYDRSWKKLSLLKRLLKELSLLRRIRKRGYDLVINLTEGDRGALAARASKAPIRVGFPPKGKWQKKLYTHIARNCPSLRHTVERNLDAVRRIGIFPPLSQRELSFSISDDALSSAQNLIGKEPFVLIHPASRWRFKCWPKEKTRALIEKLLDRGERVVLSAGPDEIDMANEIARDLPLLNLAGKLSLKQLGALIFLSKTLICVDSVPLHLASALKKPVIALFGPTSDITWGPWKNPYARIISEEMSCRPCYLDGCGGSKRSDCLERIAVERVLKTFEEMHDCHSTLPDRLSLCGKNGNSLSFP